MKKIAVIGAGLTGATAAATLAEKGYQVTVFDKGRAAGGRMSSKRTEHGYLDMGAQYFTARSDSFKQQVQRWLDGGQAQIWRCNTALLCDDDGVLSLNASADEQVRYIGVPAMQSPVKALLDGIPCMTSCRIQVLTYQQGSWTLTTDDGLDFHHFDTLLLTLPPAQTQQLLRQSALTEHAQTVSDVLEPCWAVAMQAEALPVGDAIFCQHPKLRFISHQQHKTARHPCFILHFNAAYSAEHLHKPAEFWFAEAQTLLRQELKVSQTIEPLVAHRWLYASQNDHAAIPGLLSMPEQQLWVGGDWSYGGRVENAYLAGLELARSVIENSRVQQELA